MVSTQGLVATTDRWFAGDAALALDLAERAGTCLLQVRAHASGVADSQALKDAGDAASQALVAELLRRYRPHDAVLSEEAPDGRDRLSARRVWIVDPLDGTREFAEPGRTDWAVHVALWQDGDLVAGAVTLPAVGLRYSSHRPVPLPPRSGTVRLAVSRTRPPALVDRLAAHLGAELVPMGSAGVKATAVLRGEVDAYVHAGGQYEWDSAAPVAVARASGLRTSRVDGSALRYNQPDPLLPDLVVCRPELHGAVLEGLARARSEETA